MTWWRLDSGRPGCAGRADRLLRAGKRDEPEEQITEVCKPEYLAGSEYDRQKLEEMLLALTGGRNAPVRAEKPLPPG